MVRLFAKIGNLLAALALVISMTSANGISGFYYNNPKMPDKVKALRKF